MALARNEFHYQHQKLYNQNKGIEEIVKGFCDMSGFAYRIAKDTDTVKRIQSEKL